MAIEKTELESIRDPIEQNSISIITFTTSIEAEREKQDTYLDKLSST